MRAVIGPRRRKTARGQVAEERTRMPDLHRARTRHQSPRISEVMAESGPRVGGGKAPIVRCAMSRGSIRKQRAVEGAASREPRGLGESN